MLCETILIGHLESQHSLTYNIYPTGVTFQLSLGIPYINSLIFKEQGKKS